MYNYASKILSSFLDPLSIAVLLLVVAVLCWRRRGRSLTLVLICLVILVTFSSRLVSERLLRSLEDQNPDLAVERFASAEAIVVLGGLLRLPSPEHPSSALAPAGDRLLAAFRLYRAGKAPLIVCSGGNNPLAGLKGQPGEADGMCGLLEEWGVPATALHVEPSSINTRENAVASYELLAKSGARRILLVTSATHMPRAAAAFRKVGFEVIAAPADFHTGWWGPDPILRLAPSPGNLLDSSIALHEWVGLWVYRLRGWA